MDTVSFIKLVSALMYPVGLMAVFGLLFTFCAFFERPRLRSVFGFCFCAVFLVFSNPWWANQMVRSLESQYPQVPMARFSKHDAIIVLGGGLRVPSAPALTAQLARASDRYWYATQLFRAGKAAHILIAGGNVFAQPGLSGEAVYAKALLMEWGVPESAIITEAQSRTTEQNKSNVGALLERRQIRSALLVTSAIHMPRSYTLFQSLPMRITPAPTDLIVRRQEHPLWKHWVPSVQALHLSTLALHEYYGMAFYRVRTWWRAA